MVTDDHRQIRGFEADGQGLGAPPGRLVRQTFRDDHLRLAGLQGRHLRCLRGGEPPFGHGQLDLLAPLREQVDQVLIDPVDIRQAVMDRCPSDAETGGELVTELGGIDVAAGLRVVVQRGGVDRPPDAIGGAHRVRHKDMGVQQRVTVPRRAVPEPRSDEPVRLHPVDPVASRPGPCRNALQVGDRFRHSGFVCGDHLAGDLRFTQTPQDRHRLRRPERQVPPRHLPVPRTVKRRTAGGVHAREHRPKVSRPHETFEAEQVRRRQPIPGRFALLGVVVLDARDDLVEVVGLGAGRESVEVQHETPPPPLVRVNASPMQVCDPL